MLKDQIKYIDSLSTHMKNTIKKYTRDEYYESINDKMAERKMLTQEEKDIVDSIKLAFDSVPPLSESITVYRGITRDFIENRASFISTSLDKNVALNFANDRLKCCLLIINVPVGIPVLPLFEISANPQEKEILLLHSNFHITHHPGVEGFKTYKLDLKPQVSNRSVWSSRQRGDPNLKLDYVGDVSGTSPEIPEEIKPVFVPIQDQWTDDVIMERVKNIATTEEIEMFGVDETINSILETLGVKNISKKLRNELRFELS